MLATRLRCPAALNELLQVSRLRHELLVVQDLYMTLYKSPNASLPHLHEGLHTQCRQPFAHLLAVGLQLMLLLQRLAVASQPMCLPLQLSPLCLEALQGLGHAALLRIGGAGGRRQGPQPPEARRPWGHAWRATRLKGRRRFEAGELQKKRLLACRKHLELLHGAA